MKDTIEIDYAKQYTEWLVKTGGFARDMTMRDHFTGVAMQGLIIGTSMWRDDEDIELAKCAYAMADAMLKERAK